MNSISRIYPGLYLFLNGLLYFGCALLFFTEPLDWFERLQINLVDVVGYTELKTMYVGFLGAVGVFLVLAALALYCLELIRRTKRNPYF